MKVLFSYTLNTIKENKRTSLSIMAAVLLASTLLCALCTYGYTELGWRIEIEEYESGQWHAELGGKSFRINSILWITISMWTEQW